MRNTPRFKRRSTGMVRSVKALGMAAAMTFIIVASAWAVENAAANGKWTWKQMRQNSEVEMTLDLKVDDKGAVTGTITTGDMKTEIKEGSIKEGELAFVVVREFNGQEFKA